VDRVLNQRGSVNSATAAKVREIAAALNYTPNIAGKTLAVRKKKLKFGYILFGSTTSNPFFQDVMRGIESRAAELVEYGVTVEIRFVTVHEHGHEDMIRYIDELVQGGANGLILTAINHPDVTARVRALTAAGIPVVTANSDLPNSGRMAYVGSDYFKSGETAAGMMNLVCGGRANVGIIIGSPLVLCHSEREQGFRRRIQAAYPGIGLWQRHRRTGNAAASRHASLRPVSGYDPRMSRAENSPMARFSSLSRSGEDARVLPVPRARP
jgi:LacI family transcriptional regulator